MDTPIFIQNPPSVTEMETFRYLLQGHNGPAIGQLRCLSPDTIDGHQKALRFKFHTGSAYGVAARAFALGFVRREELIAQLPESWRQYIMD